MLEEGQIVTMGDKTYQVQSVGTDEFSCFSCALGKKRGPHVESCSYNEHFAALRKAHNVKSCAFLMPIKCRFVEI